MSPSKRPRPQPRPNHAHQEDRLPSIDHSALDPAPWCLYGPSTRSAVVRLRLGAVSSRWRAARWCSFRTPGAERAATCLQVEGESRAGPPEPRSERREEDGCGETQRGCRAQNLPFCSSVPGPIAEPGGGTRELGRRIKSPLRLPGGETEFWGGEPPHPGPDARQQSVSIPVFSLASASFIPAC